MHVMEILYPLGGVQTVGPHFAAYGVAFPQPEAITATLEPRPAAGTITTSYLKVPVLPPILTTDKHYWTVLFRGIPPGAYRLTVKNERTGMTASVAKLVVGVGLAKEDKKDKADKDALASPIVWPTPGATARSHYNFTALGTTDKLISVLSAKLIYTDLNITYNGTMSGFDNMVWTAQFQATDPACTGNQPAKVEIYESGTMVDSVTFTLAD